MKKSLIILLMFFVIKTDAQNPIPKTGTWIQNSTLSQTITLNDVGIGTIAPNGKMEIKYQPCNVQQNGLVITSLGCNQLNNSGNVFSNVYEVKLDQSTAIQLPLVFGNSYAVTSSLVPLIKGNEKPMLWVRDELPPMSGLLGFTSTTYQSKFIVLPNGNTGINTSNPRAALDVVQSTNSTHVEPTAVFGRIVSGTQSILKGIDELGNEIIDPNVFGYRTKQIMVFNNLSSMTYNRIVQEQDQAILFTDAANSDGSNGTGALVIAPWDPNSTQASSSVGGIRIDKDGKVEVHGVLRALDLELDIKWWSDFVFQEGYQLLSIDSLSNYIKLNKHLPNMPSESEVLDSGVNVGNMQALQQQKIEELTLYTIEQQNEISKLKAFAEEQQKKQKELEAKLNALINKD